MKNLTFNSGEDISYCLYNGTLKGEADLLYEYLANQMFLGRPIDIIPGISNRVMLEHVTLECSFDNKNRMSFNLNAKGKTL